MGGYLRGGVDRWSVSLSVVERRVLLACWEMPSAESKSVYPAVVRENKETKRRDPSPCGYSQGQDDYFKKPVTRTPILNLT